MSLHDYVQIFFFFKARPTDYWEVVGRSMNINALDFAVTCGTLFPLFPRTKTNQPKKKNSLRKPNKTKNVRIFLVQFNSNSIYFSIREISKKNFNSDEYNLSYHYSFCLFIFPIKISKSYDSNF